MPFIKALREGTWLTLRRLGAYPRIVLLVSALIGAAWLLGLQGRMQPAQGIMPDFVNVYAAGEAAREGQAATSYDWETQKARENEIVRLPQEVFIPWLYPPTFFAVGWLLAFLPYVGALAVYSVAGAAAYFFAVRKLAPPFDESSWLLAAFPGAFINLFSGQNGFLTTAFMAAGLFLLNRAPVLAGIALGALSYKPHFFILIPLALLAGRYWKALASTLLFAALTAVLSGAAFGLDAWIAFFKSLSSSSQLLELRSDWWLGIMHSVFSMARVLGASVETAMAIHAVIAAAALGVLLWIWKDRSSSLAVRGASLAAAALLASPYSFAYDQVLLAIPIALLAGEGLQRGFLPFEKTFLFVLWLLPFLVRDSTSAMAIPLTPPMLALLMAYCWVKRNARCPARAGQSACCRIL